MTSIFGGVVSFEFSVAFSKNATDTVVDGDYTNLTKYVHTVTTTQRGRSSERDGFVAGTASVSLFNEARIFDPDNASSPYFGNLKPMRHCRLRATDAGGTSYLYKGYVLGWDQTWMPQGSTFGYVILQCTDAFTLFARASLPESIYAHEVLTDTPLAWWRMGEQDGSQMLDSSGNSNNGIYANGVTFNTRTGAILNSSNNAVEFVSTSKQYADTKYTLPGAVSIEFWYKSTETVEKNRNIFGAETIGGGLGVGGTYLWIYVPVSGGADNGKFKVVMGSPGASSSCYSTTSAATGAWNHVVVCTRNGTAPKIYVNGTDETTGAAAVSGVSFSTLPAPYIASVTNATVYANATIDEVAIYNGELAAGRVLAHYQAGATAYAGDTVDARITRTMGATTHYSTFPTSLDASTQTIQDCNFNNGSTKVLDYLLTLLATEGGQSRLFIAADGTLTFHQRYHDSINATTVAAFSDASGSTLPYLTTGVLENNSSRVLNDVTMQRVNGSVQHDSDATSDTVNGTMSLSVTGLLAQTDVEMLDRAGAEVYRYKDVHARLPSLTYEPWPSIASATLLPIGRSTDLGARISVRKLPENQGSAWTRNLTVEGISHTIDPQGSWNVTYLTAPYEPAADWWIWDSAVWDTNVWGF